MKLSFITHSDAQKVADDLNARYAVIPDSFSLWKVQQVGKNYLIIKEYLANIEGVYTVTATIKHLGA